MRILILGLFIIGLVAGCGDSAMNIAQYKQELMDTDRAFNQMAVEQGRRAAFEHYMADSAVMYRSGKEPFQGREQIMQLFPPDAKGQLTWAPTFAEAAASGDLGYTLGTYDFKYTDENGEEQVSSGHYITVWKRQLDGSWKYVFDTGT
jgi:ketosteroid isomerase-like protein